MANLEAPQLLDATFVTSQFPGGDFFPLPYPEVAASLATKMQTSEPHVIDFDANSSRFRRLGRAFEQVVGEALSQYYSQSNVRKSVVLKTSHTIGELDFLIELDQRRLVHLEVACKFFLYVPGATSQKNFFGPRLRDRLDLKLHKLFHQQMRRQLPLDLLAPATEVWRSLWLTGMLCYPWSLYSASLDSAFVSQCGLNGQHLTGWWLTQDQTKEQSARGFKFFVIPKPWWLFPFTTGQDVCQFSEFLRLQKYEADSKGEPEFCLRVDKDGVPHDRGFIVSDSWLPNALASIDETG